MHLLTATIPAICFLIAPVAAGASSETSAAQAKLQIGRMYAAQDAGVARINVAQVFTGCSPSYFESNGPGDRDSLADVENSYTDFFQRTRAARQMTSVKSIEVRGRIAVALVTRQVFIQMENRATGRTYLFQASEVDQDNWSKTAIGWEETSKTKLKQRATMDGKPFRG